MGGRELSVREIFLAEKVAGANPGVQNPAQSEKMSYKDCRHLAADLSGRHEPLKPGAGVGA